MAAETAATPGQADDARRRVVCTLPTAEDVISEIRFARLPDGRRCSERVAPAVAARFCTIPGYEPAPDDLDEAALDLALAAISLTPHTAAGELGQLRRTNAELERANHALSADRDTLTRENATLRGQLATSEVPRLKAEIERLQHQVDGGPSALQDENVRLASDNATLLREVEALRARLTASAPAPTPPVPPAAPRRPAAPTPPPAS